MMSESEIDKRFGQYIEMLRRKRGRTMRETAIAMEISAQFLSEVEKGRRTLTAERMDKLRTFLNLSDEESRIMYDKAAETRKYKDVAVPQDFSDYIVERDYAMAALRVAKRLNANEDDWQRFVDDLVKRREGAT